MNTMTAGDIADLLYPPENEPDGMSPARRTTRTENRRRMARKRMRQWGVAPVDDRIPRLYPADAVLSAIRNAPGSGNRSPRS